MEIKREEQLMGFISKRRLKGLEKKVIYYISQAACRINLQNHGRPQFRQRNICKIYFSHFWEQHLSASQLAGWWGFNDYF